MCYVEPLKWFILGTFRLNFVLWGLFLWVFCGISGKKMAYDLKTIGQILMQFYMYMLLCIIWFYKSNRSGHSWPLTLTLRIKVDDSA